MRCSPVTATGGGGGVNVGGGGVAVSVAAGRTAGVWSAVLTGVGDDGGGAVGGAVGAFVTDGCGEGAARVAPVKGDWAVCSIGRVATGAAGGTAVTEAAWHATSTSRQQPIAELGRTDFRR